MEHTSLHSNYTDSLIAKLCDTTNTDTYNIDILIELITLQQASIEELQNKVATLQGYTNTIED